MYVYVQQQQSHCVEPDRLCSTERTVYAEWMVEREIEIEVENEKTENETEYVKKRSKQTKWNRDELQTDDAIVFV